MADARYQTTLPELRPGADAAQPAVAAAARDGRGRRRRDLRPPVPSVAAGFALLVALAWRRQGNAVAAIEERDAARFYVDRTSAFAPIRLDPHARLRRDVPAQGRPARPASRRAVTDVLIVSLGTTGGLRAADDAFAASLRRAGATVEIARAGATPRGAHARPHRPAAGPGGPGRPSATRGRSSTPRSPPRCSRPRPGAIRFDAPAAGNRPGRHGVWQRPAERRRLAAATAAAALERGRPRRGAARRHPGRRRARSRATQGTVPRVARGTWRR